MAADNVPSSPACGFKTVTEELAYYKAQYQTLEEELQEFQASSKELEAELEKDVEESEKRERRLQEKVEKLGFEVEEWKTKYKQSRTETNSTQNTLQKEITALRDSQRTLQLKLRDIEVQNDDFERQARHTTSSLEDVESKYNVALERTVILDEEIKIGEQERESLRIENQRLRDELSDLRIEAEIVQEKLRIAEETIERLHQRKPSNLLAGASPRPRGSPRASPRVRPRSPASDTATSRSSLTTASTPPRRKTGLSAESTPPSPPLSESSLTAKPVPATPMPTRKPSIALASSKRPPANRTPSSNRTPTSSIRTPNSVTTPGSGKTPDTAKTAKAAFPYKSNHPTSFPYKSAQPRHSRGPSYTMSSKPGTVGRGAAAPAIRPTAPVGRGARPSTGANGLSAAPARTSTAGGPPRSGSLYQIRGLIGKMQKLEERVHSARSKLPAPQGTPPQRGSPRNGSAMGSHIPSNVTVRSSRKRVSGSTASSINVPRESGVSRLSFGVSASGASVEPGSSRPSSRASLSSQSGLQRPGSRSSTRTPLGHYASSSISGVEGRLHRPRSSMSGSSAGLSHGHSRSISSSIPARDTDDCSDGSNMMTPTARRMSINKTGIPTPSALPMPRRQSGSRKASLGMEGDMGPPARPRKMSEIGETF